ncbi:hypothetical protein DPMN_057906 [Dreissena polymorpha]|uniref:Uncharacterized protein n=1 Tax=Dreissena polymorpha TaxID=45954 RepID=A0A9D4C103_DREPO|nr:hypothetical protein DPMN_057906 [Dreissena polymorpha]
MHRLTSDYMAPTVLRSLHGTVQGVDHVALSTPRSASDHMAPAIHRSLPRDFDQVASAMRRSTSDHMASAILRSLPGNVTGHFMTGPFNGPWSLTGPVPGNIGPSRAASVEKILFLLTFATGHRARR